MASNQPHFDPYYKWLGIPPEDQPANHYRLLGIQQFEQDPEVVATAADRQMAHVQTYAIGREGELAQNLLDELAKAKICLLNPHKKRAYDLQLKNAMGSVQRHTTSTPGTIPPPVCADAVPPRFQASNTQVHGANLSANIEKPRLGTRRRSNQPIYFLIALLSLLLVSLVVWQRMAFIREMQARRLPHQRDHIPAQEDHSRPLNENARKIDKAEPSHHGSESKPLESPSAQPIRIPKIPVKAVPPSSLTKSLPTSTQTDRASAGIPPAKHESIEKSILIDLSKKQMVVPLQDFFPTDEKDPHIKILGIRQEGLRYSIVPPNGIVAQHLKVELLFPEQPNASLLISLKISNKKPIMRISPELTLGRKKHIPFTMDQIQLLGVKANKRYARLNAELGSTKRKKQQLETWISAPILKGLQAKRAAQAQVIALGKQIPEMEKIVQAAQNDVQLLLSCQKLAKQLDKQAELRFIPTSTNGDP